MHDFAIDKITGKINKYMTAVIVLKKPGKKYL